MITKGKKALERLTAFRARNWYTKEFPRFINSLCQDYALRSEVVKGGKVSAGTQSATVTGITLPDTWCVLNGQMYQVVTTSDNDVLNSAGDQASLVISFSTGAPTISAASTLTVTSGGKSFVARFFDSNNGESFDTSSTADLQIDVDLSTLDAESTRDAISTGLASKFANYTVANTGSGPYIVTITAPVGHGYDFTYAESAAIGNVASGTNTQATVEFGGVIYTDGSSASGASGAASPLYMALIATNSDNEGGTILEGSNCYPMVVVSKTDAYPTSEQIQDALDASSANVAGYNHSGYTGWVHLAQLKNDNGTLTITSNLNNHLDV